jgi:rhamnosyltransferase
VKISIALLTKDGGGRLAECLRAIRSQLLSVPFEIVAIDSGSKDGSLAALSATPGLRLVRIPSTQFQHGRTRNLAMSLCAGERVVFLTQDAVPVEQRWLADWLEFMDHHPAIAGAFGHQIPHIDADPLEAWEVQQHFDSFRGQANVFCTPPDGGTGMHWSERARRHFFSNVNSCVNRWAWEKVKFPEVEFGEDQLWAIRVQAAGMSTAYAERPVVRHSHNYGNWTLFRRRYDEARMMAREFGYALVPTWAGARAQATELHVAFEQVLATGFPEVQHRRLRAAARAWSSALGRFAGTRLAARSGSIHRFLSLTVSRTRS